MSASSSRWRSVASASCSSMVLGMKTTRSAPSSPYRSIRSRRLLMEKIEMGMSSAGRPASAALLRNRSMAPAGSGRPPMLSIDASIGHHSSAYRAACSMPSGPALPSATGTVPSIGLGYTQDALKLSQRPSKDASSSFHAVRSAATRSSIAE